MILRVIQGNGTDAIPSVIDHFSLTPCSKTSLAHLGVTPLEFRPDLWRYKTRIPVLSYIRRCLCDFALIRFGIMQGQTDRRTNGQTDGWTHDDSIYRASIASCGKNRITTRVAYMRRLVLTVQKRMIQNNAHFASTSTPGIYTMLCKFPTTKKV